jgi:acid stress-induced BolA-like protein IbaG/YrbA
MLMGASEGGFEKGFLNLNTDTIRDLIEQGLPGARAVVQGEDGVHFEALVVAEAFRGKLPLARHRLVYATLGELMGGEIHALALRTLTPDENGSA